MQYENINIDIKESDLKELKKFAKKNKVSLNQVIVDAMWSKLYFALLDDYNELKYRLEKLEK